MDDALSVGAGNSDPATLCEREDLHNIGIIAWTAATQNAKLRHKFCDSVSSTQQVYRLCDASQLIRVKPIAIIRVLLNIEAHIWLPLIGFPQLRIFQQNIFESW